MGEKKRSTLHNDSTIGQGCTEKHHVCTEKYTIQVSPELLIRIEAIKSGTRGTFQDHGNSKELTNLIGEDKAKRWMAVYRARITKRAKEWVKFAELLSAHNIEAVFSTATDRPALEDRSQLKTQH